MKRNIFTKRKTREALANTAGVELTQSDVLWAYDLNMQIFPSEVGMSYTDYYATVGQLRDAAASI